MADYPVTFTLEVKNSEEIKRKFEEPKKALEDLKKAADDANKPLDDTAKSLGDLAKSAGDVDKDLDDTAKALDDVSKSAGDISKDLDAVGNSFDDISKSAGDVSSDLKDADSAFSDIASNADGAVSSMDAVKSSFEGISESAVEADQNIQSAVTGLEGVGTATESAAAGADALATSLDNIAASAQEAETNISAAANGIDGIGTSIGQAETALDGLGSAFDGAGTSTTTFNDVLSSTGSQAQAASGGLTPLNTVLGQVGGATQQASGGFQGFNSSLGIMTGFIGTAAAGALQFVTALNNLHGAQIKVDAAQVKLSGAIEAENKARAKLNELLESGTATTEQIAQAELDLEQAHAKTAIATERAGKAQDDLNIKYAKFATDVLPSVIQTVTSTIGAASQLKGAFGDIGKGEIVTGLEAVGGAAAIAVAGFKGLEVAIKAIEGIQAQFNGQSEETVKKQKEVLEAGKSSSVGGYIDLIDKLFGVSKGLDESLPKAKQLDQANKDSAASAKTTAEAFDVTTGSTKSLGSELTLTAEQAKQVGGALGQNAEATKLLGESAAQAGPAVNSLQDSVRASGEAYAGAKAEVQGYSGLVKTTGEAIREAGQAMEDDTRAKELNAEATRALIGSTQETANVIATLDQAYADSQASISQLNTELTNSEAIMLRFETAVNAGHVKFLEWVKTSQDAAVTAQTFKADLEGMANTFGGLPGFMEGTVEEYQAFIEANTQGGDAVEAFSDMALESWRGLVSAAEPLFNDLKSAWRDIFEGDTLQTATDAIAAANDQIAQNVADNNEAIATSAEGTAPKIKDIFDGVDWEAVTAAMQDPFSTAFNKLPAMVSDQLDIVERDALTFQAKFATIAENAGTTFATNLQANMGQGFDQALAKANQAVVDMLAPFIAEHPEMGQMFQPLFDAMNKTGPGAGQAVQDVLEEMSGMPGPVGQVASSMLTNFQTEFGDKIPGVTKGGVEGAIQGMTEVMQQGFQKVVDAINGMLDNDIKQTTPTKINVDKTQLDDDMARIQQGIDNVKQKEATKIMIDKGNLDISLNSIQQGIDNIRQSSTPVLTVNTDAAVGAVSTLRTSVDGIASKTITISADTSAVVGAAASATASLATVTDKSVTISADASAALGASASAQASIDGIAQTNIPGINADDKPGIAASGRVQGGIDNIRQQVPPTVDVNTAAAEAKIQALGNAIARLGAGASAGAGATLGTYQPGTAYPGINYGQYASGFGPEVVTRPTRILVGEAGPELVSVIPMSERGYVRPQGSPIPKTAAAGMGQQYQFGQNYGYSGQGLWQTDAEEEAYKRQVQAAMQQGSQQGASQGSQEGTAAGINQSAGRMGEAVQQGAQQGVQDGMQQGGGYPQAPSQIQAMLQGGMSPQQLLQGFGQGRGFTWTGGAMGTALTPSGGGGAQYPMAPSDTSLFGTGTRFNWTGGAMGTQLGQATAKGFASGLNTNQLGGQIGAAAARGLGTSITVTGGLRPGQSGGTPSGQFPGMGGGSLAGGGGGAGRTPGVYTGQVPASYGKPLGQLINGIAATILPGQGPIRQAALGMHERLKKDTMIQAHKNEYVDIGPKSAGDHPGKSSGLDGAAMGKITQLLERLLSQGSTFKVDFNVDGRRLSSVAAKNMGTAGYGDK